MPQRSGPFLRCFIAADDLTGSCDAAVHFAQHYGMNVQVAISVEGKPHGQAQVFAVNTDSRCASEETAAARVRSAFQAVADQPCALFKKIDSTLRGHIPTEIAAAADAANCDLIYVAPALPALGRKVTEGRVHLPSGEEIDIAAALGSLPFASISTNELAYPNKAFGAIQQAQARGIQIICFDAATDAHLDQIVDLGHTSKQRILWTGSAGLAAALARAIASSSITEGQNLPQIDGPLLLGIGSNHPTTLAQLARLRENAGLIECSLETFRAREVREAVHLGRSVLLHLPPCGTTLTKIAAKIRAFSEAAPLSAFGALVLTGGDTASIFLNAIGADTLDVRAEAMPGIPVSIIRGGLAEGMSVITKSGAFGSPRAFLECLELFAHAGTVVEEATRP